VEPRPATAAAPVSSHPEKRRVQRLPVRLGAQQAEARDSAIIVLDLRIGTYRCARRSKFDTGTCEGTAGMSEWRRSSAQGQANLIVHENRNWDLAFSLQAHNLKVIGSNPIPATAFVITHSPSRSNHRDGLRFCGERRGLATKLARLRSGSPRALVHPTRFERLRTKIRPGGMLPFTQLPTETSAKSK
jgi:hypothetical protein